MRRLRKVTASFVGLLFAGSVLVSEAFGYRIRADERPFAVDIRTGLATGHLGDAYVNGKGYQSVTVALLRITGLEYDSLELLSPVIGVLVAGCLITILLELYVQEVERFAWWEPFPLLLAIPVLPGLANRLRETSHKAYTVLLVGLAAYLAVQLLRGRRDARHLFLAGLFIGGLALINWIWAGIYGGYVALLLVGGVPHAAVGALAAAVGGSILLAVLSPVADANRFVFFRRTVQYVGQFLGDAFLPAEGDPSPSSAEPPSSADGNPSRGSIGKARRLIGRWRVLGVGPVRISTWFFAWSSVLLAGIATACATIGAALDGREGGVRPLNKLVLVTSGFFGLLLAVTVAGNSIATAKRLVALPGIVGILYVTVTLSGDGGNGRRRLPDIVADHRRLVLAGFIGMLGVTAVLGTSRLMLNGSLAPWDVYVSAHRVAKIEWMARFGAGCLRGTSSGDARLASELLGEYVKGWADVSTSGRNVVYDSGPQGKLVCVADDVGP